MFKKMSISIFIFVLYIYAIPYEKFVYYGPTISGKTDTLTCAFFRPLNYDPSKKYPIVLTLHGLGESGTSLSNLTLNHMVPYFTSDSIQSKYPCFVFSPQTNRPWTSGGYWNGPLTPNWGLPVVMKILDSLIKIFPIDTTRQYIAGLSDGGVATWYTISAYPGRFAAAVPTCGRGDTAKAKVIYDSRICIWANHGRLDNQVSAAADRDMFLHFAALGGNPLYPACLPNQPCYTPTGCTAKNPCMVISDNALSEAIERGVQYIYTEYPELDYGSHNAWNVTYTKTPRLASWIFSKKKPSLDPSLDQTPPSSVPNLRAIPSIVDNQYAIKLFWDKAVDLQSGISYYKIYRNSLLYRTTIDTFFSDLNLSPNSTYNYEISAINRCGFESPKSSISTKVLPDTTKPRIFAVYANRGQGKIIVDFTELIDNNTAAQLSNYKLSNGITISGITLDSLPGTQQTRVILIALGLTDGQGYTLTISGIRDRALSPNSILPNSSVQFIFSNPTSFKCDYYEIKTGQQVPKTLINFDTLTPVKTTNVSQINLSSRQRDTMYAIRFKGQVRFPLTGDYVFCLSNDDYGCLYVDSMKVIENSTAVRSPFETAGVVRLTAGIHTITVLYYQSKGTQELSISCKVPGLAKAPFPEGISSWNIENFSPVSSAEVLANKKTQVAIQVVPNSFRNTFSLLIHIPERMGTKKSRVELRLFTINGRLERLVKYGDMLPGDHMLTVFTCDNLGKVLVPGLYVGRLKIGNELLSCSLFHSGK